jgi:hypothetical protein
MDWPLLQLVAVTFLFGPAVAIPFGGEFLGIELVALAVLSTQAVTMIALFFLLEYLDYGKACKRAFLSRVCDVTHKQVDEIGKNADNIMNAFYKKRGFLGYYFALALLSFAIGFGWAVAIAYYLRLKRRVSFISIFAGSAFSFLFWYLVVTFSLNFVTANVFTFMAVGASFFMFFYGRVRERKVIKRVSTKFSSGKEKSKESFRKGLNAIKSFRKS